MKINENVVQKQHAEFVYQFDQYLIHQKLKNRRCVNRFKRYHDVFEKFVSRTKNCFSFVFYFDFDAIIRVFEIKFDEVNDFHQTI